MKRHTVPTTTHLLELALNQDDFKSVSMLAKEIGREPHHVQCTLIYLRHMHVADVVINPDGTGWWYRLPPENDLRIRTFEERPEETAPRKRRIKTTRTSTK